MNFDQMLGLQSTIQCLHFFFLFLFIYYNSHWISGGVSGFEILAFPCNQFLKQEPGTSEDAQQFACTRYKAEYPIFQKVLEFTCLIIFPV